MTMVKDKTFPLPSQNAWNGICRLRQTREAVKSWLEGAEQDLKDARREIDELGVRGEDSNDFKEAAARKERAERQRDALKERLKVLANKMDEAVNQSTKGEEKLFDDIDWKSLETKPTARDMYHADTLDDGQLQLGEGEKQTKPVGRPGPVRPEQPDLDMADGEDQHLAASVHELDVREDLKGKLVAAKLLTVAHLARICDGPDSQLRISQDANIEWKDAAYVVNAVVTFRAKHRKAKREVESGEPSAGGLKLVGAGAGAGAKPGKGAGKSKRA